MPTRFVIRRARGWRKPENGVIVSRSSRWGNPFKVGADGVPDRATAVALFREWVTHHDQGELLARARHELAGRDLGCYCSLDGPCHAEVWLELVNAPAPP